MPSVKGPDQADKMSDLVCVSAGIFLFFAGKSLLSYRTQLAVLYHDMFIATNSTIIMGIPSIIFITV